MSSLIVPVTLIEKIMPHSNADALELAHVLGWQLVVKKGEYQVGDKIVYFQPDTMLPLEVSERFGVTKYLSKQRIRCAKLRGEPSFGLAVRPDDESWPVGENVAEYYGATKYEPPVRPGPGDAEANHPLFWEYTEIENLRNFPTVFEEGETVLLTEKIHGCLAYQVRVTMADGTYKPIMSIKKGEYVLGVDQHGKVVPTEVLNTFKNGHAEKWLTVTGKRRLAGRGNHYWAVHFDDKFESSIYWFPFTLEPVRAMIEHLQQSHRQVILFGEVYGSKIQSFHYGFKGIMGFRAFDLLIDGKYLDWQEFVTLCEGYDIQTVPLVATIPFSLDMVKQYSEGKTLLMQQDAHIREGLVVRPLQERIDPGVGRVLLKYVSDSYLFGEKTDYTDK